MKLLKEKISTHFNFTKVSFGKNMVSFRWIFLIFIVPIFYFSSKSTFSESIFLELYLTSFIYNIFATFYILRKQIKEKPLHEGLFYTDTLIISLFSSIFGGINSDIYIVLFFIVACFDIGSDINKMIRISLIIATIYSISCIAINLNALFTFNYQALLLRDLFIFIVTYSMSLLSIEVEKFDALHKREFRMARTDKLTGLPNRHYLEQKLKEELEICKISKTPLNILMFDIDNFKKFNDSYGHVWGDKLLAIFSDIITQNIRKVDIPARYGGEEFIILVRNLDSHMAKCVGNRIRKQLEKQKIYVGQGEERKRVTVSCGVAEFPTHSDDIKKVIELADKALYHAKSIGKNIVVDYDEVIESEKSHLNDSKNIL